jgi:SAM-dependent methyltransferase
MFEVDYVNLCPVCSGENFRPIATCRDYVTGLPGAWQYVVCTDVECQHVWLHNRPRSSELGRIYSGYYAQATEPRRGNPSSAARRWLWPTPFSAYQEKQRELDPLLGLLQDVGKVLEVGAGSGFEARLLRRNGHRVIAQDISPFLTGPDDFTGTLDTLPMSGEFDALYSSHSIEHVADVKAEVFQWRRLVRDDGALLVRTPNVESLSRHVARANWRGFEPPRHFHVFSATSLRMLLLNGGFKSVTLTTSGARGGAVSASSLLRTETAPVIARLPLTAAAQLAEDLLSFVRPTKSWELIATQMINGAYR